MTVSDWYNSRKGQTLLVPGADPSEAGQCVQSADYALNEIYGAEYIWANAIDWWNYFNTFPQLAGFEQNVDGTVKTGDFVIFNEQVGSVYGHIDIAMQDGSYDNFQGADSNWGGNKTLHLVQHTNPSYIIGTLRPKEQDMHPNSGDVINAYQLANGRAPTQEEIDVYVGKPWNAPDGLTYGKLFVDLKNAQNAPKTGFKPINQTVYTKE